MAPFIPVAKTGGRPRTTDPRAVLSAIFYVAKTGCQWRQLPKGFPPWQTVFGYYTEWRRRGFYRKLNAALYALVRTLEGRTPTPSALVIDTQSVKTGKYAPVESRGYDGGKKVKGRKRVLIVDTLGYMVDASVVTANTHDTKAAITGLARIKKKLKKVVATVQTVYADKGFQGALLSGWVKANLGASMNVTANLTKANEPFVPAKKRWVVERTFAWLGDYRRLDKDHERSIAHSRAMVRLASIRFLLRTLYPPDRQGWPSGHRLTQ